MLEVFPYLKYGFQENRSVDKADSPHTDNCDESTLALQSAGILGVAMHRHIRTVLQPVDFPLDIIQEIVRLLYICLWTEYILRDAVVHKWILRRRDGLGRPVRKQILPPLHFQCRDMRGKAISIHHPIEGWLLAPDYLFCMALRRGGDFINREAHQELCRIRDSKTRTLRLSSADPQEQRATSESWLSSLISAILCTRST